MCWGLGQDVPARLDGRLLPPGLRNANALWKREQCTLPCPALPYMGRPPGAAAPTHLRPCLCRPPESRQPARPAFHPMPPQIATFELNFCLSLLFFTLAGAVACTPCSAEADAPSMQCGICLGP